MDIIDKVLKTASSIHNGRQLSDVAIKFAEESGEVMGEVSVITGLSCYKESDSISLVRELADVIRL